LGKDVLVNDVVPTASGLYDDFPGRRTPRPEDYKQAVTQGLVVPDANVLLNLYRYDLPAQEKLLDVLERLGAQLWVPHQVLDEFWRRREDALHDLGAGADRSLQALGNLLKQAGRELHQWANRTALPDDKVAVLDEKLESAFRDTEGVIQEAMVAKRAQQDPDTNADQVLVRLETILAGRVGSRLDAADEKAAIAEGLRRVGAMEPPGYKDRTKDGDRAAGDYLVWEQTLKQAEHRMVPVLFVTEDRKEDWWLLVHGQRRGPRPELVEEMRSRAGVQLLMTQTDNLLRLARDYLAVEVSDAAVEDVSRVASSVTLKWNVNTYETEESEEDSGEGQGWTQEGLDELLKRLETEGGRVQRRALTLALDMGGFVAREDVYRLGEYDSSRTLRGFTRPVARVSQRLREEGLIAEEAPDPLTAVYDPTISYVQAAGFRVPRDVLRLVD